MKGLFVLAVLCLFAAAQGRGAGFKAENRTPAVLGQSPWLVHLRVAVSTSGLLNSCAGTLIDQSWVLTSASCVFDARFVWLRYGAVDVISPELVTESSAVRIHENYVPATGENNIALVSINRVVQSTENIRPISLVAANAEVGSSGSFCGFGELNGAPGEQLSCIDLSIESQGDGVLVTRSEEGQATRFDVGAPLVNEEGVQVGILVSPPGPLDTTSGLFINPANYAEWIQSQTGLDLSASSADYVAPSQPDSVVVVNM